MDTILEATIKKERLKLQMLGAIAFPVLIGMLSWAIWLANTDMHVSKILWIDKHGLREDIYLSLPFVYNRWWDISIAALIGLIAGSAVPLKSKDDNFLVHLMSIVFTFIIGLVMIVAAEDYGFASIYRYSLWFTCAVTAISAFVVLLTTSTNATDALHTLKRGAVTSALTGVTMSACSGGILVALPIIAAFTAAAGIVAAFIGPAFVAKEFFKE